MICKTMRDVGQTGGVKNPWELVTNTLKAVRVRRFCKEKEKDADLCAKGDRA